MLNRVHLNLNCTPLFHRKIMIMVMVRVIVMVMIMIVIMIMVMIILMVMIMIIIMVMVIVMSMIYDDYDYDYDYDCDYGYRVRTLFCEQNSRLFPDFFQTIFFIFQTQDNSEILHGPRRNNCLNYENNE